ncbi:hypothetical protein L207DRAFT_638901 [Hyaloscypha variabilis F]|uniref:Modin n=1 Tax=Hyaloscypha variabilis (strain UAMH 11265 / GT02V1 / F) TaxID=1149755 RepID=A0A2J6R7A6_HYAVF|nr:hypothetical protein L207DRAFT_638901 [Hyaloscypha variabilis F]
MAIDPTALTALIISLVALVATFAQLLQQYFATADGYRQCLPEVMGKEWGSKTRKRMRWGELRYETIYYVPSLSVDSMSSADTKLTRTDTYPFSIKWSDVDLSRKYILAAEEKTNAQLQEEDRRELTEGSGEKVCWVALLKRLRIAQGDTKKVFDAAAVRKIQGEGSAQMEQSSSTPVDVRMRILRRSWDFMPAEIVRPLCMSTISDIAVIAIRLDMTWKEFNPTSGTLLADGSGQLITSRVVRSLGLCLEYTKTDRLVHTDSREFVRSRRSIGDLLLNSYLPVAGVSDLLFGIVPGNSNLKCFDRSMGTFNEVAAFLDFLDNTGSQNLGLTERLKSAMEHRPGWLPGFNDVIPLIAAKMSSVASKLRNLPMPNKYAAGLLRTREGLQVFCKRLQVLRVAPKHSASRQLQWVQAQVSNFEAKHSELWNANDSTWAFVPPNHMVLPVPAYEAAEAYQQAIHNALDASESFLVSINTDPLGSIRNDRKDQKPGFCYDTLLVEHLRMAIMSYGAIKEKDNCPADWWFPRGRDWLSASMNVYFDCLDDLAGKVAEYTGCTVELAIDAWVTMIFRAFCWHHCHHLIASQTILPVEWHGSQMPVYIG